MLLWFETFDTDPYDKVFVIDGSDPFVDNTGAEIVDNLCQNERCLAYFSGSEVYTSAYANDPTRAPVLLRSTSPRVLVHWQSQQ